MTGDEDAEDGEVTDAELEEAEAAVLLAVLPDGARLPARVRERVEDGARRYLGERAKLHAQKRAEARGGARLDTDPAEGAGAHAKSPTSTTAAGSHVVMAVAERSERQPWPGGPRTARSSFVAYGGWAFAAAASIALVLGRPHGAETGPAVQRPSGPTSSTPAHVVDRLVLRGVGGPFAELRHDRTDGTAVLALAEASASDQDAREALQLWVAFEGDAAPRAITLVARGANEIALGPGERLCQAPAGAATTRCAAVRDAYVTREDGRGSMMFAPERVMAATKPWQ